MSSLQDCSAASAHSSSCALSVSVVDLSFPYRRACMRDQGTVRDVRGCSPLDSAIVG